MMCGLPCSGKSTWVEKHMNENRAKHFHLIGNECIMDRKWLQLYFIVYSSVIVREFLFG